MAREARGLCTTRCQLFNDEVTKTENNLRMKWFVTNRQCLLDNLRDDKLAHRARKIRENYREERLRRQKDEPEILQPAIPLPAWRPSDNVGSINLDIMKPIDPSTHAILYESGVESYITANNYLRERYNVKPENRFYYPDCTSWLHSWRLTDYPSVQPTKFGKSSIIRETFYRRNGSSLKRDDSNGDGQSSKAKNFNDGMIL